MMTAEQLVEVVERLERAGVRSWLDGGWGIDALVERQTRPHDDLDLAMVAADDESAIAALAPLGYVVMTDTRPTGFVLRAPDDRRVDVHLVTFDAAGDAVYILSDGTPWHYPRDSFDGVGRVGDRTVPCMSVAGQILGHIGYDPDDQDRQDMRLLRERFEFELPAPYDHDETR
jgi:lincosamide nucleotidyltransferase A/C/D/E